MTTETTERRHRAGTVVLVAGFGIIVASAAWVALTGDGRVRYSADHGDTVTMWTRWIPAVAGLLALRVVAGPLHPGPDRRRGEPAADRLVALLLVGCAAAFAVALAAVGGGEPAHLILKTALLLVIPLIVLRAVRGGSPTPPATGSGWVPVAPVVVWAVLTYASPLATPCVPDPGFDLVTLLVVLIVGFLANAVLEEVFYRRWLQTRAEVALGPWAAIVLSALLWALWHVAIQGGGSLVDDVAAVVVNQGVQGLFLGYLWLRTRRMWPLLVVHGAVNAVPLLL